MVERQIAHRGVNDQAILDAMLNVPRHWFVPANIRRLAYLDRPLPIGHRQTISQPYIVALMTEVLGLDRNSRVLEVGTGSGYQAAVLAEITPHVFTIEIVEPLARRTIEVFKQRGYDTIKVRIGDGYAGWPEHAPFDAIIVTCAPDHIPSKLIEQLKPGGRICIPVGKEWRTQSLTLATKSADGKLSRANLLPVRFVPMTGKARQIPKND
ncbi:MAG: protein-L-isoaspartate(D-aspartate) O-methyltransferase [Phycisphaerales bacterium]|nr:MAG: protein-L-isoaspartate(D-aspartate) O-methyltransferase [Phycisphaerales bacterium]